MNFFSLINFWTVKNGFIGLGGGVTLRDIVWPSELLLRLTELDGLGGVRSREFLRSRFWRANSLIAVSN